MYGWESWTIKKAKHLKNWCFWNVVLEKTLRVTWTARSNQSTLKEINPEYSLEELMLKLKLQYFGHLMPTDSLEKTLMPGKIEGRRWPHRIRWLDGTIDSMDKFEQAPGVGDGQRSLGCCSPWGSQPTELTVFVWRISRHWVNNTFPFPWWSWLILCFHKNKTCFYCRCTHSKEKLRSHTQCTTALKKKPSLKSLFSNTPGCCPWHSPGKNTRVGCHPSPGELPNLGIRSPALQILLFFTAWATREALIGWKSILIFASLFQG